MTSEPDGRPRLTVVGLGPADVGLLTNETVTLLAAATRRFVRTDRHPAVSAVGPHESFDDVYERASTMDEVYGSIVERLVDAATTSAADPDASVVYAVPGSPLVAERTVELLVADDRIEIDIRPALSFVEVAWTRLGIDPIAVGARLVDGQSFRVDAAGERGPLLVAQCDSLDVLSDIKLAVENPPESVVVLQRLGLPDERMITVSWHDLDRVVEPDHLTSVYIADLASPVGTELLRFADLVTTLRRECPWDREQTHTSLGRYLLEESYEVLDAIDRLGIAEQQGDEAAEEAAMVDLEEELGDLLFQVYFHATLAAESGHFELADVARGIHDKLRNRHPHVFGDVAAANPAAVEANWEQIKRAEKGRSSVMDGIPAALPALLYGLKVQKKAAPYGYGWPTVEQAFDALGDELDEVREDQTIEETGDVLFAAVGVARHLGFDPEEALRGAANRFRDRIVIVEREAKARSVELETATDELRRDLWELAKRELEP